MGGAGIGDMQLAVKDLSIAPWAVGNGGVLSKHIFTFSFLESPQNQRTKNRWDAGTTPFFNFG